ncbi:hypothetical protein SAMN06265795_12258 [Noviherbaspirillum humi]|uniref:Uncharacterized protein n=1 Tax=Noviherbaspirillum humi TaxID=1688639 RepID=A0A239LH07_9BURK|nr:hypothetical protein [Noviherbaspirillum humi]SNT29202.1 hypothetical protein SAMN06265795_12258 [Noviherbaspirillum humi]
MTITVANSGEVIALSYLVNKAAPENLVYRLFCNNITPAETDTASTFTEAAGGGYASKTLTGANWTITGGNPSTAAYAQQTWTFTGALTTNPTIYGYYATRLTSGDLVLAEPFTSFTPAANGDNIQLTPQITAE